jgi:hypothetical protein
MDRRDGQQHFRVSVRDDGSCEFHQKPQTATFVRCSQPIGDVIVDLRSLIGIRFPHHSPSVTAEVAGAQVVLRWPFQMDRLLLEAKIEWIGEHVRDTKLRR